MTQQWEVASGHQIGESLIVGTGSRTSRTRPALSPDGRTLATPGKDNSVRLWSVPSS